MPPATSAAVELVVMQQEYTSFFIAQFVAVSVLDLVCVQQPLNALEKLQICSLLAALVVRSASVTLRLLHHATHRSTLSEP